MKAAIAYGLAIALAIGFFASEETSPVAETASTIKVSMAARHAALNQF